MTTTDDRLRENIEIYAGASADFQAAAILAVTGLTILVRAAKERRIATWDEFTQGEVALNNLMEARRLLDHAFENLGDVP